MSDNGDALVGRASCPSSQDRRDACPTNPWFESVIHCGLPNRSRMLAIASRGWGLPVEQTILTPAGAEPDPALTSRSGLS